MIEPLTPVRRTFRRAGIATFVVGLVATTLPLAASPATAAQTAQHVTYVFLPSDSQNVMMSGSTDDVRRARALQTGRESILYVRSGGAAYVIRDASLLRQAAAIFEPQSAKGREQAALGSRQAELGSRQAKLGAEQARLGVQQAGAPPSRAEDLGRQQEALGRQQDELGRQQDTLGRQQDALGREQDRLGREADAKLRVLVDDAVRRDAAQRVD